MAGTKRPAGASIAGSLPPNKVHKGQGKRGFRVAPAHMPRDAYQGGIQRKKAQLIEKARIKKAYAKLRAEQDLPSPARTKSSSQHSEPEFSFVPENDDDHDDDAAKAGSIADEDQSSSGVPIDSEPDSDESDKDEDEDEEEENQDNQSSDQEDAEDQGIDQGSDSESRDSENDAFPVEQEGRFATQSNPLASVLDQASEQLTRTDERQGWKRHLQKDQDQKSAKQAKKQAATQAARIAAETQHHTHLARTTQKTPDDARYEANAQRARHAKLWNKPAGSKGGRARNQPNLSARVNVYLDRIKKNQPGARRR